MDGSPQLTDVSFAIAKRGYDPEEVDNYLERVNAAVVQLRTKLRDALDRADAAEARAVDSPPPPAVPDAHETLTRTLVLAQRTADEAIAEAKAEARALLESAGADAAAVLADAEAASGALRAEARRDADEIRRVASADAAEVIEAQRVQREMLLADVAALETHLATERTRLRSAIGQLQRLVDLPETFRLASSPVSTVSDERSAVEAVAIDAVEVDDVARIDVAADAERPLEDLTGPTIADLAAIEDAAMAIDPAPVAEAVPDAAAHPAAGEALPATAAVADAALDRAPDPEAADPQADDSGAHDSPLVRRVATVSHLHEFRAAQAAADASAGPPTQAISMRFDEDDADLDDESDDTDAFLSNLRRAVNDDASSGLPPDDVADAAMQAFFNQDLDAPKPRRFGRKS